jgi:hypothetical protein
MSEAMTVVNGSLVQREYGKDEGSKDYSTYAEAIDDLIEMKSSLEHQILELNWNIGRQAYIVKEGSSYGGHDVTELANDLDMSTSSVYTAIKFYETYTLEDVHRMRDANIPFRRAISMMKLEWDEREQIEGLLADHRINDDTFKKLVQNTEDGVPIPEDAAEQRAYIDNIREGKTFEREQEPEDDDDFEDDEEVINASDPVEKIRANLTTDVNNMSLALSDLDQKVTGMINVLKGDQWASLDSETKETFKNMLGGLSKELSRTLNRSYQLVRLLPQPVTKDADTNGKAEG